MIKQTAGLALIAASLIGWVILNSPGDVQPVVRAESKGAQAIADARDALEQARAAEKLSPSKSTAQAVDDALTAYNSAVVARIAEIYRRMSELDALIGEAPTRSATDPEGGGSTKENPFLAEYNALRAELSELQPGPLSPTPTITPETEPNDTCGTANALTLTPGGPACEIISGAISPGGDFDFYSFTATAGSRVWIYTDTGGTQNPGATSRDTVVTLFDSACTTTIEQDDDDGTGNGCDGTIETGLASVISGRTLTSTGTYVIRVRAFSGTAVIDPYKLFVVLTDVAATPEAEANDTAATANVIVGPGQQVGLRSGSIGSAGDADYYSVSATAGNVVYINADADPERDGTGTDLVVEFRDPSDVLLLSIDSSITGSLANPAGEGACYSIGSTGTYFVKVRHFSGSGTGTYDLMVSACSSDPRCPPATINGTLGSGSPDFPSVSGNQSGRLNRNGIASTCAAPKSCLIFTSSGLRAFDAYTMTNTTGSTQCVTVTLTVITMTGANYQCNAYLGSYDPNNICTNYLADPGLSSGIPPTPVSFSFNVAAGAQFVLVVHTTNVGEIGGQYQLTTSANFCAGACSSINCPLGAILPNAPGQCGIPYAYAAPSDPSCGAITCSPPSGSFFPVGDTTVTCTSAAGPSCSFLVTVNDTELPAVTCPANITTSNDPGLCSAVVTYVATATDNCPGVSVLCLPASGSSFPVGTTTVDCWAVDASSNVSVCSFTVTVNDTEAPVITCPPSQTACATPGSMGTVVSYPAPTATDNCSGVTVACVPPSGSTIPPGTTTVTCTATDASGNTATCSFTIDVFDALIQDDSNPLIRLMWITSGAQRGRYLFCCSGSTFTGTGTAVTTGNTYTLTHSPVDRRVVGRLEANLNRGNGSLQLPPGKTICTITDRNTLNDLCGCAIPNGVPMRKGP
jgi:hypothetical protein